eukprot:31388-Pelagococcus_subviridis.AAC.8
MLVLECTRRDATRRVRSLSLARSHVVRPRPRPRGPDLELRFPRRRPEFHRRRRRLPAAALPPDAAPRRRVRPARPRTQHPHGPAHDLIPLVPLQRPEDRRRLGDLLRRAVVGGLFSDASRRERVPVRARALRRVFVRAPPPALRERGRGRRPLDALRLRADGGDGRVLRRGRPRVPRRVIFRRRRVVEPLRLLARRPRQAVARARVFRGVHLRADRGSELVLPGSRRRDALLRARVEDVHRVARRPELVSVARREFRARHRRIPRVDHLADAPAQGVRRPRR